MRFRAIKDKIAACPHVIVALACAIIVMVSTFVPEAVGPANNGDFIRVMHPNKIRYIDGNSRTMWRGYGHTPEFEMDLGHSGGVLGRAVYFLQTDFTTFNFPSSQILTIKISKFLNLGYNMITGKPLGTYNLFWLAVIHTAIFAYAIFLILGYIFRKFGFKALVFSGLVAIFILSDQGYTFYFNSFYGEALQYVTTLLVIGLLLRLEEKRNAKLLIWYYIAVYLMATSKFAWIPVGILFAAAPLGFVFIKNAGIPKKRVFILGGATIAALLIFFVFLTPSWIERDTNFNSVFNGVLRNSRTPERDLEQLGFDPKLAVLQGYEWYLDDYPVDVFSEEFNEDFFDVINKPKILMFYMRHPSRFLGILRESASHARYIRAPYLTSVQNPDRPAQQAYRFSLWESLRIKLTLFTNLWFILFILAFTAALSIVALTRTVRKHSDGEGIVLPILMLAITISAAGSFVIPYVSNGVADQAKQLYGFIGLFDILFFTLLGLVAMAIARLINCCYKRKKK